MALLNLFNMFDFTLNFNRKPIDLTKLTFGTHTLTALEYSNYIRILNSPNDMSAVVVFLELRCNQKVRLDDVSLPELARLLRAAIENVKSNPENNVEVSSQDNEDFFSNIDEL